VNEMSDGTLLQLHGVCADRGDVRVLRDLTFSMCQETVALFGMNGSGKSTLLRVLAGLTKGRAGEVIYSGFSVLNKPAYKLARLGIGFVKQDSQLFLELSVQENLALGAYMLPKQHVRKAIEETLDICPILKDKLSRPAGTLSGGERQILALGNVLVRSPKLMLIDEPSAGVSPASMHLLSDVFARLRSRNIPILLAEQHISFALGLADRVIVLQAGQIRGVYDAQILRSDPDRLRNMLTGEMI